MNAVSLWLLLLTALAPAARPPSCLPGAAGSTDLDVLMCEVLDRRDANRAALAAYEFEETEDLEVRGQEEVAPVQSYSREFAWRQRDGRLWRDLVSVNGVVVGAGGRSWEPQAAASERGFSVDDFYDWDSLFNFPFEAGRYFLAGHEAYEGRQVLRIEYYPTYLFSRPEDERVIGGELDRSIVVTMLVLPEERQIVKWTLETVGLHFLPFRWLLRAGSVEVSMTTDRAADGTWLPREILLGARASTAGQQLTLRMTRRFRGFRRDSGDGVDVPAPWPASSVAVDSGSRIENGTVANVVFHGDYTIADEQLAGAAGVSRGDRYSPLLEDTVRRRLLESGLVDRVDVRPRRVSLRDSDEVALVVLVRRRVGLADRFQFLPMFDWSDVYGVTAGGRVSVVELWGDDERISFPLTFGGRDQAAVELSDDFQGRFISGVRGSFGYSRLINPHFGEPEQRVSAAARAFKRFGRAQVDAEVGWADVEFRGSRDQQASFGISARFDTRRETALPRNAVYVSAGWRPLKVLEGAYRNRFAVDVRGYLGVVQRTTLVVVGSYDGTDGALPAYEQYLMGGLTTLRGYEPGRFIGDNRITASAELRAPVWEPLAIVLVGLSAFWDTGAVWNDGTDLGATRFYNGVGGGVFVMATFVRLRLDVAYGVDDGWKLHFGSGLRY